MTHMYFSLAFSFKVLKKALVLELNYLYDSYRTVSGEAEERKRNYVVPSRLLIPQLGEEVRRTGRTYPPSQWAVRELMYDFLCIARVHEARSRWE